MPRPERVLVTGAAGFVGGHLLAALAADPAAPRIVAWRRPGGTGRGSVVAGQGSGSAGRGPGGAGRGAGGAGRGSGGAWRRPGGTGRGAGGAGWGAGAERIVWRDVDLLDRAAVERAVAEAAPAEVYHCGGAAAVAGSWDRVVETLRTNVLGTEHLLQAVQHVRPVARVLIPGSALVYRPSGEVLREDHPVGPVTPYGLSKLAQEMLAEQFAGEGLAVLLTRSFTHLGPGQDDAYAASSFARQIARIEAGAAEPVLRVGALDAHRDLTDVRDTVRAYRALMAAGAPGRPYNVCTGRTHRMREVVDGLLRLARTPVSVEVDPARLRPSDHPFLCGDPGRIGAGTGWAPSIALDETLRDMLEHWRGTIAAGSAGDSSA